MFLFTGLYFTAFLLPTQLETLPGNLYAQKFQSLFLVVCVMCIRDQTDVPQWGCGWYFCYFSLEIDWSFQAEVQNLADKMCYVSKD